MSIVSLYPLGVGLTVDWTSPLLALRGGPGTRIPNITEITMAFSIKRSYFTALELCFNDELTLSPADHMPCFITLEVELSDSQPKPLTKISSFLIQRGIVGTPKSVKKINLVLFL